MSSMQEIVRGVCEEMHVVVQHLDAESLDAVVTGKTGRWMLGACWDDAAGELGAMALLPVFAPEERREKLREYLAFVNEKVELGAFEIPEDRGGEIQFSITIDALEEGVPSKKLIGTAFSYQCQMVDRCFPGLMAVMFANAEPCDAIVLFDEKA